MPYGRTRNALTSNVKTLKTKKLVQEGKIVISKDALKCSNAMERETYSLLLQLEH